MRTKTKVVLTVSAFTLLGFMLNPNAPLGAMVWGHPPAEAEPPAGALLGLLMVIGLVESVAFGLGIAFLAFGHPLVRRLAARSVDARAAWLAIVWSLASWVPHTAMHMTNGSNMARLVAIEYMFHLTLVVAAAVLARFFLRVARAQPAARSEAGSVSAAYASG